MTLHWLRLKNDPPTMSVAMRKMKDKTMTDVLDVLAKEARWLRSSREELVGQLLRAQRMAGWRMRDGRAQWRNVMADISHLVDRSMEPMFDAALAVAEFAHDMRASYRRVLRAR